MLLYELHLTGGSATQPSAWGCKPESLQQPGCLAHNTSNSWEMDSWLWFTVLLHCTLSKTDHASCYYQGTTLGIQGMPFYHPVCTPWYVQALFSSHKCQFWLREQNTSANTYYPVLLPTATSRLAWPSLPVLALLCTQKFWFPTQRHFCKSKCYIFCCDRQATTQPWKQEPWEIWSLGQVWRNSALP